MQYNVINGEVSVNNIDIFDLGSSSNLMVGDIREISLFSVFEGPPETLIVGVTIPLLPSSG